MGEWKKVKLAEVLRHRKCNILINNDEEYSLCRVQLHRRGVVLREKKMGSQIKTKKQQVCKAGDLVVAEMDAKFGGYGFIPDHLEDAIVSSHYYLYELDKSKITQEYFEILIKTDFIQNQIEAKGSTNYSSIRAWEFLDYEIPLQSIALQNIIATKYLKYLRFKEDLGIELNTQLKYLSQLRQQILQEAIEGKLTAKWREEHPDLISGENHASKLLEKIKAEKERLIKEGKIKKEKPLAPIADAKKPFDLPEDWAWCRFQEITKVITCGMASTPKYHNEGRVFLSAKNVKPYRFIPEDHRYVDEKTYRRVTQNAKPEKGDILMTRVGAGIGESAIIDQDIDFAYYVSLTLIKLFPDILSSQYVLHFLNSSHGIANAISYTTGVGSSQGNLNVNMVRPYVIPLPSLVEQQAIVEHVDKLMAMIDALEKQVSERKDQAQMLMQSVLREAFEKG